MKLNIANPATGQQTSIEVEDSRKLSVFYEKRMAAELRADFLGDEWKGYIIKITGGNDEQGFPMKQGVLLPHRVKLYMKKGHTCYFPRRTGERKRKSVRGCIVGPDIAALNLVIVKKGEKDLPGLTDKIIPRRLGPKRVGKIRKMFALDKEDDVRKFVVRREIKSKKEGGKSHWKAPKIQRLVTPKRVLRKRKYVKDKKMRVARSKRAEKFYKKLVEKRKAEKKAGRK